MTRTALLPCCLAVLLLIDTSAWATAHPQDDTARALYQNGVNETSVDKRIEIFTKVVELEPQFVEALYRLGAAYAQQNNFEKAEHYLQKALQTRTGETKRELRLAIWYELALTYAALGRTQDYEKMLRGAKNFVTDDQMGSAVSLELGRFLYRQGRYQEALAELQNSQRRYATMADSFASLIQLVENARGNSGDSMREQNQNSRISNGPKEPSLLTRGDTLASDGDSAATRGARAAQQSARHQLKRQYIVGTDALESRDWTTAIEQFQEIMKQDPHYLDTSERLAEARQGLLRERKNAWATRYYAEGLQAVKRGRWQQAYAALKKAEQINREDQRVGRLLAEVESKLKEQEQSLAPADSSGQVLVRQFESLAGDKSSGHVKHVALPEESFDFAPEEGAMPTHGPGEEPALADAETNEQDSRGGLPSVLLIVGAVAALFALPIIGIVTLSPIARARIYLLRGKYDRAATIYEKLLLRNPARATLYPQLASIYLLSGRTDEKAMQVYQKVLQLNLSTRQREKINSIVAQNYLTRGSKDDDAIEVLESELQAQYRKQMQKDTENNS